MRFPRQGLTVTAAVLLLSMTGLGATFVYAANHAGTSDGESAMSEAGVRAVEDRWSMAEATGDTDFLGTMLAPAYRSISGEGKTLTRTALLEHAAKNKGTDEGLRKMEAYKKDHPYGTLVTMQGNSAVVNFYDPARGAQEGIMGADIFIYADGRWQAIYSQHIKH
ncbi:MAG TPA: nuclear transport factor 2 family protein [Dyella sp.]|uniref:nuclear transport factor 2 family protein n=1 Tax=Dyella sp. TaxID=1869338 RepID=UPI002F920E9E